ncbi:MAG TPA: glycosyltransferase [Dehalococcoidia bacterium]|nr:glycosyltransferase [Dehalococcoidia bacterium]
MDTGRTDSVFPRVEVPAAVRDCLKVPFVSVIIPVLDDPEGLRACLTALAAQTYPAGRFEVVIVDNGSGSPPSDVVAAHDFARLEIEPAPGSYAARNRGIEVARGEVLAFTDADCLPAPDWLERGIAALVAGAPGIVAGRIEAFPKTPGKPTPVELYDILYGYRQRFAVENNHSCFTANVLCPRSLIEDVGPFDATLLSGGDMEWSRRAHWRGYPVRYADDTLVRTPARGSLRALIRRTRRFAGGSRGLRRLREAGTPWLARPPSRWPVRREDLRLLFSYPQAPVSAKLLTMAVALLVRASFAFESARLRLGARPLR